MEGSLRLFRGLQCISYLFHQIFVSFLSIVCQCLDGMVTRFFVEFGVKFHLSIGSPRKDQTPVVAGEVPPYAFSIIHKFVAFIVFHGLFILVVHIFC